MAKTAGKSNTVHAFEFLHGPAVAEGARMLVVFGDEPFLKRQALASLRTMLLGDDDVAACSLEGKGLAWRDVADELATVSLFGGGQPQLVIVEEADEFVSKHRGELEAWAAKSAGAGRLVLVVSTWASNTRLYKLVDQSGLQIECRAPERGGRSKAIDTPRIEKWLIQWGQQRHAARLRPDAAKQLLELVGPEFGLLDQELAKLVLYIEPGGEISRQLVDDVVGGWRAKTIWEVVDAATEGNTAEALTQLDRLLQGGENPLALFGQLAWSLRRYAAATRCFERAEAQGGRISLDDALIQAGFPKWSPSVLDKSKQQLQQLGRRRAGSLFRWLLETDLALKGSHSSPPRARWALELLVMRMSGQLPR